MALTEAPGTEAPSTGVGSTDAGAGQDFPLIVSVDDHVVEPAHVWERWLPAKHRDALMQQCEGRMTLTKHPHGCLLFFPRPVWEEHREQIAAWPMSARAWQRIFLGNACDVEMDGAGRVLISPELRNAVGLEKEVMMLGMGTHFEIWDAAKLAENEAQAVAGGMPDVLSNFSF